MKTMKSVTAIAVALTMATALPLAVTAQDASAEKPPAANGAGKVGGNDFPTQARVEYVLECMSENAGPPSQEMFYKCVCAADAVASRVSYERWVELSVFNAARPIAGERGAYLRERRDAPSLMRAYREVQASAYKSCFIRTPER